jgi:HTH-type transcriptional regulator, quorum sensing regulator NprR
MDFLTPGQKIRKLRKELNMNQEDLASDTIARPFISMIEIGKRGLSYDTAKAIAEKFNKHAQDLGIKLSVDADFILRKPSEDAELYCLEILQNNSLESIKEVIQVSTQFQLELVKAKAYLTLGDFYINAHNYIEAFANHNIALDLYKNTNKKELEPYLYKQLGHCKYKLLQFGDALLYFERSYYYSKIYENMQIQRISIYNMAMCYKKLDKIETALYYVDMYLSLCDKHAYFDVYVLYANILKANCYELQNDIDKALNIYNCLVSKFSNSKDPILGIVYNNLGLIYLKKDEYLKSLEYFNLAQKFRMDNDIPTISHTIIEKSEVFIKQKLYTEAIMLIELGLEFANNYNDMEYLLKGKQMLVQIYTVLTDYPKLESTCISMLELLKDTKDYNKILEIYNILSIMYLSQNNTIKVKDYLLMSQKLIESSYNVDYNSDI